MSTNPPTQKYSDYQYILAYGFIIGIFMLVTKTRLGYVTVYYLLALMLFTMILLAGKQIASILAPLNQRG